MDQDIIRIERFSKKRYDTYKQKGIPFRVVSGNGRLCEVKAFDCGKNTDEVFVESTYMYCGRAYTNGYYASQKNGCVVFGERDQNLFIYIGPWFRKGDLVVATTEEIIGRTIFFWEGIRPKEGEYIEKWGMYSPYEDMHGSEFSRCMLGGKLKRENCCNGKKQNVRFRLANNKDAADYRKELRNHRVTWENDGRFYYYPNIGDHYFEIFFSHGKADFRECVMDREEDRPEISRLIMECNMTYNRELRESRVRKRIEEINKALEV